MKLTRRLVKLEQARRATVRHRLATLTDADALTELHALIDAGHDAHDFLAALNPHQVERLLALNKDSPHGED